MDRSTSEDIRWFVNLSHINEINILEEDLIVSITESAMEFLEDGGFLKAGETISGSIVKQALDLMNCVEYSTFERYLLLRCALEMDFGYTTGMLNDDTDYSTFGEDPSLLTLRLLSGHEVHEAHEVLKKCL